MASITTRETAGTGATVAGVPLTNQQIDNNFINLNTELIGKAEYPTQTGNNGKYLTTNGTTVSWGDVTLPSGQTAGSVTAGYLQYSGTAKTDGQLYGGTNAPSNTTRLNFDGHFYATKFFGDGSGLTGAGATIIDDTTTNAARYLLFDDVTSGSATSVGVSSTKLTFNPSTGVLATNGLSISGNINATGAIGGEYYTSVISGNTNAQNFYIYVMTNSLTLTLPASPTVGDWVGVSNRSGTTACVIARNGSNIMSLAEDMVVDALNASFKLIYADATRGWTVV